MSTGQIIRITTMGLVFLAWAWLMFRTLFLMREREAERTGQMLSGPGGLLHQIGYWLKSPEDRNDRKNLLFLTGVLAVMIAMQAMLPDS
jgi:hypothetical protein